MAQAAAEAPLIARRTAWPSRRGPMRGCSMWTMTRWCWPTRGRSRPVPGTLRLMDFGQPVAILFVAVLHFLADPDHPHAGASRFAEAAATGSYLVVSP